MSAASAGYRSAVDPVQALRQIAFELERSGAPAYRMLVAGAPGLGDGSRADTQLRNGSRMRCSIVSRATRLRIFQRRWKVPLRYDYSENRERHQS